MDCGLFVIAAMTSLAHNDPSEIEYNQNCMRLECYYLTCFPKGGK